MKHKEKKIVGNFVKNGKIITTYANAKAAKSLIDRLAYKAIRGRESDRNILLKWLGDRLLVKKLIDLISSQYVGKVSGFVRLERIGLRKGDAVEMARMEWVKRGVLSEKNTDKTKLKPGKTAKTTK